MELQLVECLIARLCQNAKGFQKYQRKGRKTKRGTEGWGWAIIYCEIAPAKTVDGASPRLKWLPFQPANEKKVAGFAGARGGGGHRRGVAAGRLSTQQNWGGGGA